MSRKFRRYIVTSGDSAEYNGVSDILEDARTLWRLAGGRLRHDHYRELEFEGPLPFSTPGEPALVGNCVAEFNKWGQLITGKCDTKDITPGGFREKEERPWLPAKEKACRERSAAKAREKKQTNRLAEALASDMKAPQ